MRRARPRPARSLPSRTDVRHLPRQIEQRLLGIIELRRERTVLRVIDSQALANVVEASSHRERRGRQDHRVELFKQPLPQNLADVNWRCRQEYAFVPPLIPIDEIPLVRFEEEGKLLAQLEAAPRDARQFFRLRRQRRKLRLHAFQ